MLVQGDRWSAASDVIPMFPTLVWKLELQPPLRETIEAKASAALSHMRRDLPPLAPGQGWQSVQTLHRLEDFQDLVVCIHRTVAGILQFLRIGYDEFEITACWATILAPGAEHKAHSHPNNFLSGVYYLWTYPGADTINFHDPRDQTGIIRPPVVELTAENTDQVVVQVKNGTLLLFPAWLRHSVGANTSEAERISISFNIMFSSFTEHLAKPLWSPTAGEFLTSPPETRTGRP
ncbi:2OG-Fe(II) oxygenase family protein [Steroidobacter cummioxidans]|uniref:2OG-Fe(II) oxygenase family protein n=1 Tax=Steroidobacter cummioxidans TaxID=1803913 RepID=UPI000E3188E3|nr:2OG-Fe(II) oxygenase family protein [Steroidobacter cummioxidans]